MEPPVKASNVIEFGRFKVHHHLRELHVNDIPVEMGVRAFDLLMALIDAKGSILSKDELMNQVWPGRVIEENTLQVQISVLRKTLSAEPNLIRTAAGRGYYFAGQVGAKVITSTLSSLANRLPESITELVPRESELIELVDLVAKHRLVTLTGSGGIGKTQLSLEAARQLLPKFVNGVFFVELELLTDPKLLPMKVAHALGLALEEDNISCESISKAIESKQFLVLLDNCEHLIGAAASMVAMLLRASARITIMATSREPLHLDSEYVYLVPSLGIPPEDPSTTEDILQTNAVKLFLMRVQAADRYFVADPHKLTIIGNICRHLDGIPLAIELAAARVAFIGVYEVASRLHDRFRLLTGGSRIALPRHQTLRATLDWSYELLPESERIVLRRCAIFAGSFTLEAAIAVVAENKFSSSDVIDFIGNLAAKSLVMTADVDAAKNYRLLETTRAYALEMLRNNGEFDLIAECHAKYYLNLLKRVGSLKSTQSVSQQFTESRLQLFNVQTALDWAFSLNGDAKIGVALTANSAFLWFQLSMMGEYVARVKYALAISPPGESQYHQYDMQLFAALGETLMYTSGPGLEMKNAWINTLEIAEKKGDIEYQLRALWGLCIVSIAREEYRPALNYLQRLSQIAPMTAAPVNILFSERRHIFKDQNNALFQITHIFNQYVASQSQSNILDFQFNQPIVARAYLSRILWFQGFPDQAKRIAQNSVDDAHEFGHSLSLCHVLAQAVAPVALLCGDLETAKYAIETLLTHSTHHSLAFWQLRGRGLKSVLLILSGDVSAGIKLLRNVLNDHSESKFYLCEAMYLGILALALCSQHQAKEGLVVIDKALTLSHGDEERWCMPELIRIKGELLLLKDPLDTDNAESHFLEAIEVAKKQGTLCWELRAAVSFARLHHQQGDSSTGHSLLQSVYNRFTEGFETSDIKAAKALLDILA